MKDTIIFLVNFSFGAMLGYTTSPFSWKFWVLLAMFTGACLINRLYTEL